MVASPHQAVRETIIARPRLFGLGRPRPAAATVKASDETARLLLDDFLQRQPLLAAINGLIAALIAVVIIVSVKAVGVKLDAIFTAIAAALP